METHLPTTGRTSNGLNSNNECFREVISKLFQLLASWDASSEDGEGASRRDVPKELFLRWSWPRSPTAPGALERPLHDTFLNSPNDENQLGLPIIRFITDLHTKATHGVTPHPSALCHIGFADAFSREAQP
ncbi:hypothetical protein CC79DRAFT_825434 [Sarocladium strictum]